MAQAGKQMKRRRGDRDTHRYTCSVGSWLISDTVKFIKKNMFKEKYKKGNYTKTVISQKPTFYSGDLKKIFWDWEFSFFFFNIIYFQFGYSK